MGGSIQYDKKRRRHYIAVYWQGKHHKIWENPHTGEKLYDKRQAQKLLGVIQDEVDRGAFHPRFWKPDSPLIIREYYQEWLESVDVSAKTKRDYAGYFKNHIIPQIGGVDIRHLRYKHLQKLYKDLNLSTKGKYNVMGALKTMLRWAYNSEDIIRMPGFPKLSFDLPEVEYLTLEQQEVVLRHIPEMDRPVFEFGMEYGLRTQEVRALKKDCITEDEVIIKRSFSDNTLQEHTKTHQVRRGPLTEAARDILSRARVNLSPFVFVRKDGKPYTNKNLNALWKAACKAAGVNIKLQNAFRHSLGCQLLDQGEDLEFVRDVLGHTKTDMTRRYARRNPATMKDALERRRKVVDIKGRKK
ncbi:MAG: site-specific integrase [Desulfobacteraceae bacterium]|nr:site-specific integrase [Desulfobacteraceae bacterium]